jgi:hypothetical protein
MMQQSNKGKLYDIFISHSSKDRKLAIALCHYMETRGLRCWMAPRDIHGGTDYAEALVKAIKASKIMVVVFTSSSNNSKPVRNEVERAFHHQLIIIPFRTQDIIPEQSFEYFLSATHWLDAIDGNAEDYFEALYTNCATLLDLEPQQQSGTASPKKKKQPILTYVIAAIAIVLIGFLAIGMLTKDHAHDNTDKTNIEKPVVNKTDTPNNKRQTVKTGPITADVIVPIKEVHHAAIPAAIKNKLNGADYEQSDGTDKLTFVAEGTKVAFNGKVAGYDDISGSLAFIGGSTFKIISGNVSGSMTLIGSDEIKGSLIIKSSNHPHSINLTRVNE